ncbi:MAG: hypothetical protein IIA65_08265 [Planctomycetes bacterium]|nr:hypothetical protein [Planctomycetota bacterium]
MVSSVAVGQNLPNSKINIGEIGFGRIAQTHDLPQTIKQDLCRVVAIADFDNRRAEEGKSWVERYYRQKTGSDRAVGVGVFQDYREMLQDKSISANDIHLYRSPEQHLNGLNCIKNRRQPITPVEITHRSCSVCLVSHIAMQLPRKLYWYPKQERFADNDQANAMLSRPQRFPYGTDYVKV